MELQSHVELGLRYLGLLIANKTKDGCSPAENNGAVFENEVFSMRAYYWGDEDNISQLPNFKYKKFEVTWYKYIGRGSAQNRKVSVEEFNSVFLDCIRSLN